jgi:DNA-binding response OmpR family regulator
MKNNINILIVEDEIISIIYLERILYELEFNSIFKAKSSEEAIKIVTKHRIDILLMDLNIKGPLDGILTAQLLNKEYYIPIIYITAEEEINTIVDTLSDNVFGYIVKPFSKSTFFATFNIALKHIYKESKEKEILTTKSTYVINLYNGYKLDVENNTCYFNNIAINLTKKELELLKLLVSNININVSYDLIKNSLWNNREIADTTLRDLVSRLKKKLQYLTIENISNIGYILKNNVS